MTTSNSEMDPLLNDADETNPEEMEVLEKTTEFQMRVTKVKPIHEKRLYGEIRFSFHGDQTYQPGDYVVIRPQNSAHDVDHLCRLYELSDDQLDVTYEFPFSAADEPQLLNSLNGKSPRFPHDITLRQIFYEELDLSGPPTYGFMRDPKVLSSLPDDLTTQLSDKTAYGKWIQSEKPTVLTVLDSMTGPVPLDFLIHQGHLIQPRCYLVASARRAAVSIYYERTYIDDEDAKMGQSAAGSDSEEETAEMDKLTTGRCGLCFNYLQSLKEKDVVTAVLCRGSGLIPPLDPASRLVMFAGGVGFGAARAFMDQKRRKTLSGKQTIVVEIPSEPENSFMAIEATMSQYGTEDRTIHVTPLTLSKTGQFGIHIGLLLRNSQWPRLLPLLRAETNCLIYVVGNEDFCRNVRKAVAELLKLSEELMTKSDWFFEERITHKPHQFHLHMATEQG